MPVYEIKHAIAVTDVDRIGEVLAELEDQCLMVMEDKPTASAWIAGYFNSREEAVAAWERFSQTAQSDWSKGAPDLRELPDIDWKDSLQSAFQGVEIRALELGSDLGTRNIRAAQRRRSALAGSRYGVRNG